MVTHLVAVDKAFAQGRLTGLCFDHFLIRGAYPLDNTRKGRGDIAGQITTIRARVAD